MDAGFPLLFSSFLFTSSRELGTGYRILIVVTFGSVMCGLLVLLLTGGQAFGGIIDPGDCTNVVDVVHNRDSAVYAFIFVMWRREQGDVIQAKAFTIFVRAPGGNDDIRLIPYSGPSRQSSVSCHRSIFVDQPAITAEKMWQKGGCVVPPGLWNPVEL